MNHVRMFAFAASVGVAAGGAQPARAEATAGDGARAHTAVTFAFDADGPMSQVMPLFGADRERVWADDWAPTFVHPSPAKDERGMVFLVKHGQLEATWVNTELDLARGHVQYAYVIPATLATLITIRASARTAKTTHVEVTYERTALTAAANAHVAHLAKADGDAGPEWARQINAYLAKVQAAPHAPPNVEAR
ncbi:MAG TPA: hypothetical protein VIA18_00680 [Polyangia bacterium]|nr:hypothetical protein [Polyangia bacterium]